MVWQSYDNQSIIILDEQMAEQLSQYLENKESQLSAKIVDVILQFEGLPTLKETMGPSLRLSEAVEEFGRKIGRISHPNKMPLIKDKWRFAAKQINYALWNYVEMLEGCVTELFQQIEQMGFEQWNVDVIRTATTIKDELTHRMDDLIWAIRRLEQQLKLYRRVCEAREGKWMMWRKIWFSFSKILDRALEPTVRKCNKFLNMRYRKFVERYTGYLQLYETGQQSINKFYHYRVLSSMEVNQQNKLKELYFLLTLWENNQKARILQRTEPVRAVRSCLSFESATLLFKDYLLSIRNAVFDKSRLIKKQYRLLFHDRATKQPLIDNIANYRIELSKLDELIRGYKKFHLQTDPRAKAFLGKLFKKRHTKGLPAHFEELEKLIDEIKNLDTIAGGFQSSLEKEPEMLTRLTPDLRDEVGSYLHEMGQPLASRELMRRNGKALLQSLQSLEEISSFNPEVVNFICCSLCKAMCADWKYHVLQEIPMFHKLYEIHQGIFNISDERIHLNRLHKFQRILKQLEVWIKNEETLKHIQEIGLDINDLKAYLQDFLAYVQRLEPDEEIVPDAQRLERDSFKAAQALVEYLYLFGNFFSHLRPDDSEHCLVRKQLLFVDQYFEAIDRRIQELYR
ncbi:MAG TPA: hypothetical protein VGP47_05275 [Parachlamydiaceae bacterium]|nr:hypothetical protein [Parachlamydiaceae bacterium]